MTETERIQPGRASAGPVLIVDNAVPTIIAGPDAIAILLTAHRFAPRAVIHYQMTPDATEIGVISVEGRNGVVRRLRVLEAKDA